MTCPVCQYPRVKRRSASGLCLSCHRHACEADASMRTDLSLRDAAKRVMLAALYGGGAGGGGQMKHTLRFTVPRVLHQVTFTVVIG